jgi:hypothetical protein
MVKRKPNQLDVERSYWMKRARERVNYNPYSFTSVSGFTVEVLFLIIRLLMIIVEQTQQKER